MLLAAPVFAADAPAQPVVVHAEEGEGPEFSIVAPPGWAVATGEAGEKFRCAAIVYERERMKQVPDGMVRIRTQLRRYKSMARELTQFSHAYQAEFAKAAPAPFKARHPKYPTASKQFVIMGDTWEYVTFLDPGRGEEVFQIGMTKFGKPASEAELKAYQAALASLKVLRTGP